MLLVVGLGAGSSVPSAGRISLLAAQRPEGIEARGAAMLGEHLQTEANVLKEGKHKSSYS